MINIKQKIKEGPVYGTWSMLSSPNVVDVIGQTGLDFVIFDMEHGSMSLETVENMVRAAEANAICPITRVNVLEESNILRVLETGTQGIMVPHVESVESAQKVVNACLYPPIGVRGLSPYTRNHSFDHHNIAKSVTQTNSDLFVGILVEGQEGLMSLDKISEINGIDLIYLGLYDITQALNVTGDINHPTVLEFIDSAIHIIRSNHKHVGIFVRDIETTKAYVKKGVDFVAYVADSYALKEYYNGFTQSIKS